MICFYSLLDRVVIPIWNQPGSRIQPNFLMLKPPRIIHRHKLGPQFVREVGLHCQSLCFMDLYARCIHTYYGYKCRYIYMYIYIYIHMGVHSFIAASHHRASRCPPETTFGRLSSGLDSSKLLGKFVSRNRLPSSKLT